MFDIGLAEMMLIGVIALVVLGPERLPLVARKVGKFLGNSRRMFYKFQQELVKETSDLEKGVKDQLSDFDKAVKDTEQGMKKVFSLESDDGDELSDGQHDEVHDDK